MSEKKCQICPRKCGADRENNYGFCGANGLRIARSGKHYGEEPIISGPGGSGTIFFSGCSLRCAFCQNYDISQHSKGVDISVRGLADIMRRLEGEGACNINLVTPTHFALDIIRALDMYKPNIPVCYNSSGYDTLETIAMLRDYIDIYLVDFKYFDSALAMQLSRAADYPEIAKQGILAMRESQPKDIIEGGLLKRGMIVRHLVLPNQIKNSKSVLEWIAQNLGKSTLVSIMSQYTPFGKAKDMPGFDRPLKPIEYKIIVNHALSLGLDNAFVQEMASSSEQYIPDFYGQNLL